MKKCPSCSNLIQPKLTVCPHCGHDFEAEESEEPVKKTMMGIPGISANRKPQDTPVAKDKRRRSTMFGLPAQGGEDPNATRPPPQQQSNTSSGGLYEETAGEDENATQVVSGKLATGFDVPDFGAGSSRQNAEQDNPARSTAPQGFASLEDQDDASEDEDEAPQHRGLGHEVSSEPELATQVAPSSLFTGDSEADPREQSGFSQFRGEMHAKPEKHETLMGMNLDDFSGVANKSSSSDTGGGEEKTRQTMFSLPTPGAGEGLSEASEEPEVAPTQVISAEDFSFDDEPSSPSNKREDNRKRLLEKLRSNAQPKDEAQQEEDVRSTMFGIPGVSGEDRQAQQGKNAEVTADEISVPDDVQQAQQNREREPTRTPNTGVLKVAKRKANEQSAGKAPSTSTEDTGVLGGGSYMVNRKSGPDKGDAASPEASAHQSAPEPYQQTPSDGAQETAVASQSFSAKIQQSMQQQQRQGSNPSPAQAAQAPPQQEVEKDVDATVERNFSELRDELARQYGAQAADGPEDATMQHDMSELRAQLRQSSESQASSPQQPQHPTPEQRSVTRQGQGTPAQQSQPKSGPKFSIPSASDDASQPGSTPADASDDATAVASVDDMAMGAPDFASSTPSSPAQQQGASAQQQRSSPQRGPSSSGLDFSGLDDTSGQQQSPAQPQRQPSGYNQTPPQQPQQQQGSGFGQQQPSSPGFGSGAHQRPQQYPDRFSGGSAPHNLEQAQQPRGQQGQSPSDLSGAADPFGQNPPEADPSPSLLDDEDLFGTGGQEEVIEPEPFFGQDANQGRAGGADASYSSGMHSSPGQDFPDPGPSTPQGQLPQQQGHASQQPPQQQPAQQGYAPQQPQQGYPQHQSYPDQQGQQQQMQQRPQQVPAQTAQSSGIGAARAFQIVFGVLALLALAGATGLSVMAGMPTAPSGMVLAFSPALLGVVTIGASFAPVGDTIRAVALIVCAIAALGLFGVGLTQAGASIAVIATMVGALLCFVAAGFPAIVKAFS